MRKIRVYYSGVSRRGIHQLSRVLISDNRMGRVLGMALLRPIVDGLGVKGSEGLR
jgi:hypothetical protein